MKKNRFDEKRYGQFAGESFYLPRLIQDVISVVYALGYNRPSITTTVPCHGVVEVRASSHGGAKFDEISMRWVDGNVLFGEERSDEPEWILATAKIAKLPGVHPSAIVSSDRLKAACEQAESNYMVTEPWGCVQVIETTKLDPMLRYKICTGSFPRESRHPCWKYETLAEYMAAQEAANRYADCLAAKLVAANQCEEATAAQAAFETANAKTTHPVATV